SDSDGRWDASDSDDTWDAPGVDVARGGREVLAAPWCAVEPVAVGALVSDLASSGASPASQIAWKIAPRQSARRWSKVRGSSLPVVRASASSAVLTATASVAGR